MFLSSSSDDESGDELEKEILPLPTAPKSKLGTPGYLVTETINEELYTSTPKTMSLVGTSNNVTMTTSCAVRANSVNTPAPLNSNRKTSNDADKPNSGHSVLRAVSGLNFKLAAIVTTQENILERIERIEMSLKSTSDTDHHSKDDVEQLNEAENIRKLFPVDSDDRLAALESRLEDNAFKIRIVKEFSKIGGKDIKSIVYNLMPHMLTNAYASLFSWYGAKGKRVFSALSVANIIQEVVRCRIKDAANTEIEQPVRKWLSKAKEKLERKRKRDEENELENNNDNEIGLASVKSICRL
ncbi:hypothetical protein LSTR_LSTR015335 [Laodelphax striatellus]|uniref:Uncharacterized protein n=1 Tax=Laodelphax striatellus TaxID=195883 RepID=A0A482WU56_LAOST|nr:hypothetical protein LSTR_LSTR015335 [Laodelphax striatellus]